MARKNDLHQFRVKFTALQSKYKTVRQMKKFLRKLCGKLVSKDSITCVATELLSETSTRSGVSFQTSNMKQATKAHKFLMGLETDGILGTQHQRYGAMHNAYADDVNYADLNVYG